MLRIRDLHTAYGKVTVLKAIDLDVNEGEFVAILGPNGAGKSTLLKTIAGVHAPLSGSVTLFNQRIDGLGTAERIRLGLGTIPEGRQLFSDMTVRENLILGAYARLGWSIPHAIEDEMEDVFRLFPRLRDRQQQLAGSMSGGEAQMLAIARALMGRPRLLLCDEPSLGLAPLMIREMLSALTALRDKGITILMADQNALAVLRMADRGYVLDTGRLVAQGKSEELLRDNRLHAAYLGGDLASATPAVSLDDGASARGQHP
jgi:ABC-type branched-subunit amino acid transport system ATPase component